MSPNPTKNVVEVASHDLFSVFTGEESKARLVGYKMLRLGYAPSFERYDIACEDSDGRWIHLFWGIMWLSKPNPVIR